MGKGLEELKKTYVVDPEKPVERTKLVSDSKTELGENEDILKREQYYLGSLEVKRPENTYHLAGTYVKPRPIRPPFHVAAKNFPIPEPKNRPKHPLFINPDGTPLKLVQIIPEEYRQKTPEEEIDRRKAEKERTETAKEFQQLGKHAKLEFEKMVYPIRKLEGATKELSMVQDRLEGWERKAEQIQKKLSKLQKMATKKREYVADHAKQPYELMEENRLLRIKLVTLESDLMNRGEERRKLRWSKAESGPFVTEMHRLKLRNKKLDSQLVNIGKERQAFRNNLQTVSSRLSDQIGRLMNNTNTHLFTASKPNQNAEASLNSKPLFDFNGNATPPQPHLRYPQNYASPPPNYPMLDSNGNPISEEKPEKP